MPHFSQNQQQSQTTLQHLMMLPQMQQALHILQMPVMELSPLVEACLVENPLIETDLEEDETDESEDNPEEPIEEELNFNDRDLTILEQLDSLFPHHQEEYSSRTSEDEERHAFAEQSIIAKTSLFEKLMQQAHETWNQPEDIAIAEALIGNFDSRGFLLSSWEELQFLYRFPLEKMKDFLKKIQQFEPSGIGATSLQECLLIQLRQLKKENTLAFKIIENHYDDLINNHILAIQKALHSNPEAIKTAIQQDIAPLSLNPGSSFSQEPVSFVSADVFLEQDGDGLRVRVNDEFLPTFRLNQNYLRILREQLKKCETKRYLQEKLTSLKWLLRNIDQRNNTLSRVTEYLVKHQHDFLTNRKGQLIPMTMNQVAEELGLHESTVTRTVNSKYMSTPRGLILLRTLFTHGYTAPVGNSLSSNSVKDALLEMVQKENKKRPLSDMDIMLNLNKLGMNCARRTVAKYRQQLQLGNAQQRREF